MAFSVRAASGEEGGGWKARWRPPDMVGENVLRLIAGATTSPIAQFIPAPVTFLHSLDPRVKLVIIFLLSHLFAALRKSLSDFGLAVRQVFAEMFRDEVVDDFCMTFGFGRLAYSVFISMHLLVYVTRCILNPGPLNSKRKRNQVGNHSSACFFWHCVILHLFFLIWRIRSCLS